MFLSIYISDEVVSNNITIGAVNELGQGINVTLIVFSKPSGILYVNHMLLIIILVPSRRPNGIKAIRTPDRSSIYVSWNYSTFDEVGAFFIFKVSATPITTSRHRQSGTPVEKLVLYNETSTTLSVDTSVDYYVTVSYVISNGTNGDIDGPTSEPIALGNALLYISNTILFISLVILLVSLSPSPSIAPSTLSQSTTTVLATPGTTDGSNSS